MEKITDIDMRQTILNRNFEKMIILQKDMMEKIANVCRMCKHISEQIEDLEGANVNEYKVCCEIHHTSYVVYLILGHCIPAFLNFNTKLLHCQMRRC